MQEAISESIKGLMPTASAKEFSIFMKVLFGMSKFKDGETVQERARAREREMDNSLRALGATLNPTPYILQPTPYTLHPAPYTLHPAPHTPHPPPPTQPPKH